MRHQRSRSGCGAHRQRYTLRHLRLDARTRRLCRHLKSVRIMRLQDSRPMLISHGNRPKTLSLQHLYRVRKATAHNVRNLLLNERPHNTQRKQRADDTGRPLLPTLPPTPKSHQNLLIDETKTRQIQTHHYSASYNAETSLCAHFVQQRQRKMRWGL